MQVVICVMNEYSIMDSTLYITAGTIVLVQVLKLKKHKNQQRLATYVCMYVYVQW